MQDNKDIFEKSAGDLLRNFETTPPPDMWGRIDAGIRRRQRRIVFIRYSSLAATLLLLLSFGLFFINNQPFSKKDIVKVAQQYEQQQAKQSQQTTQSQTTQSKTTQPQITKQPQINQQQFTTDSQTAHTYTGNKNSTGRVKSPSVDHSNAISASTVSIATTTLSGMSSITNAFVDISIKPALAYRFNADIYPDNEITALAVAQNDDAISQSWSLALGYGMTSGSDLSQNNEVLSDRGSQFSYDDFSAQLANQTSFFEEIDNTIHDAPLALGLIVSKGVLPRVNVETGLLYTRLAFRIKTDDLNPFYRKYTNEMFYLGLPAGVRYNFIEKRKFNLYALQWAVLEKGIAGRWHIDTYNNNVVTETESKIQKIRGVQFSSVTALGGQLKLVGNISLFGQGGVQVFYLNKTQPFNIRSAKIAWPSIQAGLRVNF